MALQLFRIGIGALFRLGLCLLITGQQSEIAPDPQIKIIIHPPANAIISQSKPLFLPCLANYTSSYDDDDDVMDELQKKEKINKMKKTHFDDLKSDDHNEIPVAKHNNSHDDDFGQKKKLVYKWLKNGLPVTQKSSDFEIFPNGTLKIIKLKIAAGVYQCVVDGSELGIGAIISTSCDVQRAVFTRYRAEKNISVEAGGFVIIDCPFTSVPAANITWKYANNSSINFNQNNRYFQLLNGSLLITKVRKSDSQNYKCVAQNVYDHLKPVRTYSPLLDVINSSESQLRSGLVPLLVQNQTIEIKTGEILKLICVAYSEDVQWTFLHRKANQSIAIKNTSNMLIYRNVSYVLHDGLYNCSTSTDFQTFNVTVTVPPVIVQPFNSNCPSIGAFLSLNCTATGNPKPEITFYKNGASLVFDNIVTYNEPILKINTYEEEHKGIYQCVASNSAGEVHSSALFSWYNKNYPRRPEKVKCYPLNRSSMLIDYQSSNAWNGILYYTSNNFSSSNKWQSLAEYDLTKERNGKIMVPIPNIDLFEPFIFYVRGLEKSGAEYQANEKVMYDMSRLSKGVKCALQGLDIYSIIHATGIFIWWPLLEITNLTYLNIQFRYNDTSNPTIFSDQIIGTKEQLHENEHWDDIQPKLIKIVAKTNVYPEFHASRKKRSFLNNLQKFVSSAASQPLYLNDELKMYDAGKDADRSEGITEVRVPGLVSGILIPNTQFIDVRVLVPIIDRDGELYQDTTYVEWKTISKPSPSSLFQIIDTESRSITLSSSDKNLTCFKACNMIERTTCQVVSIQHSKFRIRNLTANTIYRIFLYDCIKNYSQIGEISVRTKEDIPGPITSYNIYNQNGWKLEWTPPDNSTGLLNVHYYKIEWTINNKFHSMNVSVDKNHFELPPIGPVDKFNITIRAVGDMGFGIPMHINSENLSKIGSKLPIHTKQHDPTLGILVGAMLSILCILITCYIIVRYRTCSKHEPGHITTRNPASRLPTQSATCNLDMHEMQNLIGKAETLPPNGIIRHSGNGNNTISERIMLNNSTPKKQENDEDLSHVIKINNDELNLNSAQLHFPPDVVASESNGAITTIDDNTAVLPQKIHSNVETTFPSTPLKINANLRIASNPQYSTDSLANTSLFDSSQQQLLSTTIDSNTSNINLSTLDENDDAFELNGDSSFSQQPLHSWSFRRPIVGPNG